MNLPVLRFFILAGLSITLLFPAKRNAPLKAQENRQVLNQVYGKVTLPETKKQVRSRRGRAYRNRHRQHHHTDETQKEKINSTFLDIIVAAYPQSFVINVQALPEPAIIYQYQARFYPHVVPITPGSRVQFINKDDIYHNVFSLTPGASFNIGRRPRGEVVEKRITISGEIRLYCDIHAHMNAFIISLETPYFERADSDGNYRLDDLPSGEYEMYYYHPNFTPVRELIRIERGEKKLLDIIMTAR
jgi:plastocyanin